MALIEIDTGIFYNTDYDPDEWYKQSSDCIAYGENVMATDVPVSINHEMCLVGTIASFAVDGSNTDIVLDSEYQYKALSVGDSCIVDGVTCNIVSVSGVNVTVDAVLVSADEFSVVERMTSGTWDKSTATGNFRLEVQRFYMHGTQDLGFLARSRQDSVHLTVLS